MRSLERKGSARTNDSAERDRLPNNLTREDVRRQSGHADYHQVTDEPQYIQYGHMARVDQVVYDIALKLGNLDHRVVVDKPKPDSPFARRQR